ncbi:hypothetical protein GXE16_12255 [Escherichia coli]|nr:hypothetical protein [Escherichia coli]
MAQVNMSLRIDAELKDAFMAAAKSMDRNGVLRRNRRNFRYPSFKPATNVSRSISSLLFWKV